MHVLVSTVCVHVDVPVCVCVCVCVCANNADDLIRYQRE